VVEAVGAPSLEVQAPPGAEPGRYVIVVKAERPATARDHDRVAAERAFAQGETLRQQGDGVSLRAAMERDRESLERFRALGDTRRQADVLDRLGDLAQGIGEGEQALSLGRQAVDLARVAGEERQLGRALGHLGIVYRTRGEPERAIDCFREALRVQSASGEPEAEAGTSTLLGRAYADLGDVEGALAAFGRAGAVWRRLGSRRDEGDVLVNLGRLDLALGEPERARAAFSQALPLFLDEREERARAGALAGLGMALRESGQLRPALLPLWRARQIYRHLGNLRAEAVATIELGRLAAHAGRRDAGRAAYGQALELLLARGYRTDAAVALANLGRLENEAGRPADAAAAFTRALPLLAETGNRLGAAAALSGLARARRAQGDLDGARAASERALAGLEALRRAPVSLELRSAFFSSRQEPYELHLEILMDLDRREPGAGWASRALETTERARARAFLDALAEPGAGRRASPELLARQREVGRRLAAAEERRRAAEAGGAEGAGGAPAVAAAEAALAGRLDEAEDVRTEIRRAALRDTDPPEARPASLTEIRREAVDRDTLLLEYTLGEEASYLWAVTPDAVAVYRLPPRTQVERLARAAVERIAVPDPTLGRGAAEAALAELSRVVLGPVAGRLSGKRVLVVPDGALHAVPWAALPPLAEREVATLPSASALVALRRRAAGRRPPPATLAVLADPVFDAADPRVVAAPDAGRRGGEGPGALPRFRRLPHAAAEARAILALAPPDSLAALGFAASRETVESGALSRYRILHFATHGVLDAAHPDLSGVVLSQVDRQGRPQDGLLRMHEIYGLTLPADLVVLSACQTALGREVRGEGLVGLTRAFFYAGARRVLVSLWPVEDEATAELMRRFYRGLLAENLRPAAALHAAQASLRRERGWEAPYYWAGFVLQGDW